MAFGISKEETISTCTMANNTQIIFVKNISYNFEGDVGQYEGLSNKINITSPSFSCNITNIYTNFSDHSNGTKAISKENFNCTNCDGLTIPSGQTSNITLQANFPEKYNGTYFGQTNLTFVCDDSIQMHYIYVYGSNLTVLSSVLMDNRENETMFLDFGSQYQGTNATLNFSTLSDLPFSIKEIIVKFTDYYYNYNYKIGNGNFSCTNCSNINSTNQIPVNTDGVISLQVSVPVDAMPNLTYWGNVTIIYITDGGPVYTEIRRSNLSVLDRNIIKDYRGNATLTTSFGEQYQGLNSTISVNITAPDDVILKVEIIFTDYYNSTNNISGGNFACDNCAVITLTAGETQVLNLTAHYLSNAVPGNYYGNVTIKQYGQVFVYQSIYSSNLTVLNATIIKDYRDNSSMNVNFGNEYVGLSKEIKYTTFYPSPYKIINVSVEFTDYVPCNGTLGTINKGNFTCEDCDSVVPISIGDITNLTFKINYHPLNDKTGDYCGNVTLIYRTIEGLIYIVIAKSNLTVLSIPSYEYVCPINNTGYCGGFVEFDPTTDGINTTAKLPFNATNASNLNIKFAFSNLTCNTMDTPNCSGGSPIPTSLIRWDNTEILYPNFENVTFTINVPAGTKAGNYTGTLNISYVYNTSPPQNIMWKNVSVRVVIGNNEIIGKVLECENNVTSIKNATVILENRSNNTNEITRTTTNNTGDYKFFNILEGNYTIYVKAVGKIPNYINLSHNGFNFLSLPNILLCKAASISGYVREATTDVCSFGPNQTAVGAKVELINNSNNQIVCVNYTDNNGFFLFEYGQVCAGYGQVMPGNYTISFSKSKYITGNTTILNYTINYSINYGHQVNWNLCKAMAIEINVTGCANDNAANVNLEGAQVDLIDSSNGNVVKNNITGPNGKVIFTDIPSGTYYYNVTKSKYIANKNSSDTCTYTSESSNCDREFPLCKAIVIEINVTGCTNDNAANVNLEGAQVDLIDSSNGNVVKNNITGPNGKVIFTDIPSGTYYYNVTKSKYI
ncbi:MAG: SpaA isopeptide-forming pilin-related protein, partial [Candidatus Altarchaeum sp.]|nr:SpaA isopeptide-forming pilin-related protein [Candidatus Altarchaeum sp.]